MGLITKTSFTSLRTWWQGRRKQVDSPWSSDVPATTTSLATLIDDEPSESDAPIPLPSFVPEEVVTLQDRVRFRVVRHYDSLVYQLYAGNDGEKAVDAWENYRACPLPGVFWFLDTDHASGHRGTFSRATNSSVVGDV